LLDDSSQIRAVANRARRRVVSDNSVKQQAGEMNQSFTRYYRDCLLMADPKNLTLKKDSIRYRLVHEIITTKKIVKNYLMSLDLIILSQQTNNLATTNISNI
jgi:hypothetical protein